MAASSGLFLTTIYNQSQLAERKHVARYWSINTATMAVPLSAHPSPLVITTKLAAAMLGVPFITTVLFDTEEESNKVDRTARTFAACLMPTLLLIISIDLLH